MCSTRGIFFVGGRLAVLEFYRFTPHRSFVSDNRVTWSPVARTMALDGLPSLFWDNGKPWCEANLWFHDCATSRVVVLRTVQTNANALFAFAKWLEKTNTDWWEFPTRKSDRCLIRYRGTLVAERDAGTLAPSTASQRMRVIVRFYRWLQSTGLLSPAWPLWRERTIGIRLTDAIGFERTISVQTTDLSIPNRVVLGERLEGGLLPVSHAERDSLLAFAYHRASTELFLLLALGFFTGMRIGTLTDLKVQTLLNATPDPLAQGLFRLAVGPGADPPVATKFGVTGQVWISGVLLDRLIEYVHGVRRLSREAIASADRKDLVFLTRFGNRYAQRESNKSSAVNVEMYALKKRLRQAGISFFNSFRFHQTRCTFATELARFGMQSGGAINTVGLVKEALLQKDEATALKYIRFNQRTAIKEQAANSFASDFMGLLTPRRNEANE
jgi:integrase